MKTLFVSRISLVSIFIYLILAIAALCDSDIAHIVGVLLLFLVLVVCDLHDAVVLLAIFTPNLAILTLSNEGVGLLGLVYLVVFLKFFLMKKIIGRSLGLIIPFVYLLSISFVRIIGGNSYDFLILGEVLIVLCLWDCVFRKNDKHLYFSIYNGFALGCIFMLLGMVLNYLISNDELSRLKAILDDSNFCSMSFLLLFSCSLVAVIYKVDVQHPLPNIIISLLGGLLTGSRGFLLSISVVVLLLSIVGLTNKRGRKVVLLFFIGIMAVLTLYFAGEKHIVGLYENTIGRTLTLKESYVEGTFMDVSSGRFFLWNYYMDYLMSHPKILLFGKGFDDYYLSSNGGYKDMCAHNSFIGSLMGVGIIGTIMIIISYFTLWTRRFFLRHKNAIAFLSILGGGIVGFFFLDGILDMRFIMFFVMTVVMYQLYVDNNRSNSI